MLLCLRLLFTRCFNSSVIVCSLSVCGLLLVGDGCFKFASCIGVGVVSSWFWGCTWFVVFVCLLCVCCLVVFFYLIGVIRFTV